MLGAELALGRDETKGEELVLGSSEPRGVGDVDGPDGSDGAEL